MSSAPALFLLLLVLTGALGDSNVIDTQTFEPIVPDPNTCHRYGDQSSLSRFVLETWSLRSKDYFTCRAQADACAARVAYDRERISRIFTLTKALEAVLNLTLADFKLLKTDGDKLLHVIKTLDVSHQTYVDSLAKREATLLALERSQRATARRINRVSPLPSLSLSVVDV